MRKGAFDCCREKGTILSYLEASCECSVKRDCEAGDSDRCRTYAEHCCEVNDDKCKCDYHTKACRGYLETDKVGLSGVSGALATHECALAKEYCCQHEPRGSLGGCRCDFWEPLCMSFPKSHACDSAVFSCCGSRGCWCDFATYFEMESEIISFCSVGRYDQPDHMDEADALEEIFVENGGQYWLNNTGWASDQDYCGWYGIQCDDEGFVTELSLRMRG